jgi:hypothetical protein
MYVLLTKTKRLLNLANVTKVKRLTGITVLYFNNNDIEIVDCPPDVLKNALTDAIKKNKEYFEIDL